MVQAAVLDGLVFDAPPLSQYGFASAEVDVSRCQVADALGGVWAKAVEAEPPLQRADEIVHRSAPAAGRVAAVGVAQGADEKGRLREGRADPRRHDRLAACYRDPCKGIGHRPACARIGKLVEGWADLRATGLSVK